MTFRRLAAVTTLSAATAVFGAGPASARALGAKPPRTSGDYSAAVAVPANTRNYQSASRPNSTPITQIVIHVTQSSAASAVSWFANPRADVSAHYVVRASDGAVVQSVPETDIAWHAGNRSVNGSSIGIEHEGYVGNCASLTEAMYESSARLVAHLAIRYGIPADRRHIIGHSEVPDPTNPKKLGGADGHTDPGRCWNWPHYMSLVRAQIAASPLKPWSVTLDNADSSVFAADGWRTQTTIQQFGRSYALAATGAGDAFYRTTLPITANYALYGWWPSSAHRSSDATLTLATTEGPAVANLDETTGGGRWTYFGTFPLAKGATSLDLTPGTTGPTAADAFRLERVQPITNTQLIDSTIGVTGGRAGISLISTGSTAASMVQPITPPQANAAEIRGLSFSSVARGALVSLGSDAAIPASQLSTAERIGLRLT